jgi:hypothetical protein
LRRKNLTFTVADLRGALGASDLLDFVPAIAQTLEHFTKLPSCWVYTMNDTMYLFTSIIADFLKFVFILLDIGP